MTVTVDGPWAAPGRGPRGLRRPARLLLTLGEICEIRLAHRLSCGASRLCSNASNWPPAETSRTASSRSGSRLRGGTAGRWMSRTASRSPRQGRSAPWLTGPSHRNSSTSRGLRPRPVTSPRSRATPKAPRSTSARPPSATAGLIANGKHDIEPAPSAHIGGLQRSRARRGRQLAVSVAVHQRPPPSMDAHPGRWPALVDARW